MMLQFLHRLRARSAVCRAFALEVNPQRRKKLQYGVGVRFKSFMSNVGKPLGLKDSIQTASGLTPTTQMLVMYVAVAISAMGIIGRYKSRDAETDESVRIFNMAKRAVVKDHRVFETVGYPKHFERIGEYDADGSPTEFKSGEGSFEVTGDKGSVVVHYRKDHNIDEVGDNVTFDRLSVNCEDGTEFSALESFMQKQDVVTHQNSEALGNKLFFPVIGGVLIGGLSSFFVIRILRNRPFYVHKLVLDHINNHNMARQLLGHPIRCDKSKYVGELTTEAANYTITCTGPKGNGTIIVKAFKKDKTDEFSSVKKDNFFMTPGTSWKFSTLVLSVSRSEKRKAKVAKTINLLKQEDMSSMHSKQA
ncbi:putative cytochrome oxidase assembly protein [Plasmopara halstedii]